MHHARRLRSDLPEVAGTDKLVWDRKRRKSIARTREKFEGKVALLLAWEAIPDADPEYLKRLRRDIDKYRVQLRYKGADL
jgi:hypothetical protein